MEADNDYPTGDVGEQLEQSKEKRVSSYFTRWKEYTDRPQNHLHFIHNPGQVSTIYYDSSSEPSFLGADSLIDSYGEDIQQLIDSGANHRGYISTDYLFLKLQHSTNSSFGRILVIPKSIVDEFLREITTTKPLSKIEHKTLLQLVCGLSLRDAAAVDGVSYETKRVQVKAISAKTKLKGQLEITNYVLTNLSYLLGEKSHTENKHQNHSVYNRYINHFLPASVKTHITISSDGQQHRFLEMGHEQGTPVIVLHSLILPFFEESHIDELIRLNLRLIWPIRQGAISDPNASTSTDDFFKHTVNGFHIAHRLFCDSQKVAIAAIGQSAQYAIEYSASFPDKISQLIFIGTIATPFQTYCDRSGKATSIAEKKLTLLSDLYPEHIQPSFHNPLTINDCLLDQNFTCDKVEADDYRNLKNDQRSSAHQYQLTYSRQSIKQDICHLAHTNTITEVYQPLYFIHGEEDKTYLIDDIVAVGKNTGGLVFPLKGEGHFVYENKPIDCLNSIKAILSFIGAK